MTLNDMLDMAIRNEIASQKLYGDFLAVMQDPEAKTFLAELVREEKLHEEILTNVKEMEMYDGSVEIENPEMLREAAESHKSAKRITASSSIQEVLDVALEREDFAQRLFRRLSQASAHPELKQIFDRLAVEEMTHHERIQKKYAAQKGELGFEM